jgi:ubiquitin carboxyl-terminal hydrolase L3
MNKANWPPLESDPDIFNKYFHKIGLSDSVYFKELLSFDYKNFFSIGGPLLGLILTYSRAQTKPKFTKEEKTDSINFYMKQTNVLDNACGLIAGLHLLGNNNTITFKEGSILSKFYELAKGKTFEERATLLENYKEFKEEHHTMAQEGQSEISEQETDKHYIAFVLIGNAIYELDGIKNGPVIIKEGVTWETFMDEMAVEVMRRVNEGEIHEQINALICADDKTQLIDFLED